MMAGLVVVIASVLMQLALGGVYAWSAFVPALREHHALAGWQAGLIFGTSIAAFTLTMVAAGRHLDRVGPRRMALAGALFYGAGYYVAGASDGEWPSLWMGIGLLSGVGIGLGYVCPLTACVRWFPARKGLVTGIAVAGFGGGAIILAEVAETLLSHGWEPLRLFRALGIFFWCWLAACALFMRFPAAVATTAATAEGPSVWRDPRFLRLFAGMFCGTFGGLLAIGHLKPIALVAELSSQAGALAVAGFAAGNALGRIVWGSLHDRFGSTLVPVSMGFLGFVLLGLLDSGVAWRFVGASLVAGFGFGSCFVLYAAETAAVFGVAQVPRIYPKIFLAYGVAGITGPLLGGWLYDVTGAYVWPVATAAVVAASGALFAHHPRSRA
ncbi:MAG TPA: MFS transporter [Kiritimatiellia bacterium]|nr:MFS transporter [Kiritimatiellia bacterium]HMP33364.1 MFS transporter [Kiritimatiellia bacterium]